jgi:hypothetical protein
MLPMSCACTSDVILDQPGIFVMFLSVWIEQISWLFVAIYVADRFPILVSVDLFLGKLSVCVSHQFRVAQAGLSFRWSLFQVNLCIMSYEIGFQPIWLYNTCSYIRCFFQLIWMYNTSHSYVDPHVFPCRGVCRLVWWGAPVAEHQQWGHKVLYIINILMIGYTTYSCSLTGWVVLIRSLNN